MKTLILLIFLLPAICGAQTKDSVESSLRWKLRGQSFYAPNPAASDLPTASFGDESPCIRLSDFLAYAQECWDDSTLTRVHTPNAHGEPCIVDWECLVSSHWSQRWLHREESFSGFILWLRKNKQH